jgi:arylsulfatase A-like enzyme/tetratricopeptide (TPR) repeat protein
VARSKKRKQARPNAADAPTPSAAAAESAALAPPAPGRRRTGVAVACIVAVLALAAAWWARPGARRPNLLLVTIDTLRADHVGVYGASTARTPSLDALAARGTRFARAETAVPITGPAHATILTGLYPPLHGVRDNVVFALEPRHRTLAAYLQADGYRTAAFVGAYPVAAAFGFKQGFATWSEDFKESDVPGAGAQRPANEVVDAALGWLQHPGSGPFFAWIHLYDPHAPYDPPEPYRTQFAGRLYDGEIAFADAELGRVFDWLRSSGREADTVVAMLSDHGEALGEHGEVTHAVLLHEATLHVPLLLAGPGVPKGRVVEDRVATVDVLPTLLKLVGAGPGEGLNGRDLGPALRGERLRDEPLYAESVFGRLNCRWSSLRSWTSDDWKLVQGSRTELFHLSDDPRETRDLSAEEAPRVERMKAALQAAVAKMAPKGDEARAASVTPDSEAMLRSLGYVGGSGGAGSLDEPGLPDPRDRVQYFERLQVILRAHDIPVAQAAMEAAEIAKHDPGNPFVYETIGSLAYRSGRLAEAAAAFHKALELDPERPDIRQNYGKLLRDMDRLPDSEKELRLALAQTDAQDTRTRASLAETLARLGKTDEAQKLVADALRIQPGDAEALAAQGRVFAAQGKLDEAAKSLEAAGGAPDVRIELARVDLRRGDLAGARAALDGVFRANPGHPWALAVLGQIRVLEGGRDEGLALLRRAEAAQPRRPDAWLSLAEGYEAAKDPAGAARCRQAARALRGT